MFRAVAVSLCLLFPQTGMSEMLPDSLVTPHYMYYYSLSNHSLARAILREMRLRDSVSGWYADKLEADLNYNNRNYNLAIFYYNKALADNSIRQQSNMYETALISAAEAYEKVKNYDRSIEYLEQSVTASEESGDPESLGKAYALLGVILYEQNNRDKAYEYLSLAVSVWEQSDFLHKYPRIFDTYANMALFKTDDGDYNAALDFVEKMPGIIESAGSDPCRFMENYTSAMWKDYYNYRATILCEMGDRRGAYGSYLMWKDLNGTKSVNDLLILDYLIPSEHWDEAILYCTSFNDYIEEYPYSYEAQVVAQALETIYEMRGMYDVALRYNKQLLEITDTMRVRESQSRALEYATIYETQKKDAQLAERNVAFLHQRKKTRVWFALCAISITALVLIVAIDRRRRTAYRILVDKNKRWAGEPPPDTNGDDSRSEEPSSEDFLIMQQVREYVESRHNYRNPTLNLDILAAELSVNRKYISMAINHSTSGNFNAYINELRVKEAVRLLSDKRQVQLTIDDISERAGFNNRGSFYEWFKKHTGLTPSQFRRNISVSDD